MSTELLEQTAPPSEGVRVNRRKFLLGTSGAFVLHFCMPGMSRMSQASGAPTPTQLNSYIQINADNTVTVYFGGCEFGQGAMSGLTQLLAEELMVAWTQVQVQTAVAGRISYITGGSSAVHNNYLPLRQAGAAVRTMLIQAAAANWGVPIAECSATNGTVVHGPTSRVLTYAAVAPAAALLTPPTNPALIPDAQLRFIGKSMPRFDIPSKANGKAVYGIDVRVPNMVYAVVRHCPSLGGTLAHAPQSSGGNIIAVVPLGDAVATVADTTWDAWHSAGGVTWNVPASSANINTTVFNTQAATIMANGPVVNAETVGNVSTAMNMAAKTFSATYSFPYLAHACMEVLNCTVSWTPTSCVIWAPTQAASWVLQTAQALTGLAASQITVNTTLMGGGLGRKIEQDYIAQAITVGMAVKRPVKLMWPREEDFGKDKYRPMVLSKVTAGVDNQNAIVAWDNRIISPSILAQRGWIAAGAEDGQSTEGATQLPYAMGNRLVEFGAHPSPVPIGFWRSVGHSYNCFVVETMIDELAHLGGIDPYTYRRNLLVNNPRYLAVLDAAATLGNYTAPLKTGHARGIAIGEAFGTVVAQVVEISNATATSMTIVSVACAVDLGRVINPDSVTAQMEGGILHGISSILWGNITFANGVASVKNFSNYRIMKMHECPTITVTILPSTNPPSGAGEPGVPPVGPALANAYFKLTGKRVRTLPFFPTQSRMSDG